MRLFTALLLLLLPAAATAQAEDSLEDRIWLPASHSFISQDDLARRMAAADFVLLGERHDNPRHHQLQDWALRQIIAAGRKPLVAFEMITPDQQAALAAPGDTDALALALDWPHSGWPDFIFYRPLFADALAAGLEIRPANLPKAELRALAKGDGVAPDRLLFYRLDKPMNGRYAEDLQQEIRDAHCGQLPESAVPNMVSVQRARDAAMAHALADASPGGGVLIAGAGHTRSDRGAPVALAGLAPQRTVLSVGFTEIAPGQTDPASYDAPYDAVWFTSAVPAIDGCAEMKKAMKKKG